LELFENPILGELPSFRALRSSVDRAAAMDSNTGGETWMEYGKTI
jgi:hypothetical protein